MSSIRINLSMALITLVVLISTLEVQRGVLAIEQKNTTDAKPETPLWQISSTQSSVIPTSSSSSSSSSSIAPSTSLGPVISSSQSPPFPSVSSNPVSHNTARDEIYIDDEGLEGSGRGEIHDDLEKEPEYSGSGFGPDDEDSSSSSTTHQRKKGNAGHKSTNSGNGGHKSTNSKNQSQESILDIKPKKQPEKPIFTTDTNDDDLESGSGDKIDTDDEDEHIPTHEKDKDGEDIDDIDEDLDEENTPSGNKFDTNSGDDDDLTTEIDEKIPKFDDISIVKSNPDTDSDVVSGGEGNEIDLDRPGKGPATGKPASPIDSNTPTGNDVFIMDKSGDRTASFFAQPGILAAVIGGAVVGLLCAILVVMFIVYRMRKKDEGSYALDEPSKRSPAVNSYAKNANNREFYA